MSSPRGHCKRDPTAEWLPRCCVSLCQGSHLINSSTISRRILRGTLTIIQKTPCRFPKCRRQPVQLPEGIGQMTSTECHDSNSSNRSRSQTQGVKLPVPNCSFYATRACSQPVLNSSRTSTSRLHSRTVIPGSTYDKNSLYDIQLIQTLHYLLTIMLCSAR